MGANAPHHVGCCATQNPTSHPSSVSLFPPLPHPIEYQIHPFCLQNIFQMYPSLSVAYVTSLIQTTIISCLDYQLLSQCLLAPSIILHSVARKTLIEQVFNDATPSYNSPMASFCSQGDSKFLSATQRGPWGLTLSPYLLTSCPLPRALCTQPHGYSVPSAVNTLPHPKPVNACLRLTSLFQGHFFGEPFLVSQTRSDSPTY